MNREKLDKLKAAYEREEKIRELASQMKARGMSRAEALTLVRHQISRHKASNANKRVAIAYVARIIASEYAR